VTYGEAKFQNALWDAINAYATACGGDPSEHVYGNVPRMNAVVAVNAAVRAEVEHWKRGVANRDASLKLVEEARDRYAGEATSTRTALSTALSLLEAVLTADRERHAYLVGEIERLDPAAGAAMLAALAAAPALPLERIAALLHERGRSLRWPEK
jgi:hypothetical protein